MKMEVMYNPVGVILMGMEYSKLWIFLRKKEMQRTDLIGVISSPTLAKLAKGQSITTDSLGKICAFLKCQPGDIMEYQPDDNKG
jgi:DNA-binding Xre family transcriptional regulator